MAYDDFFGWRSRRYPRRARVGVHVYGPVAGSGRRGWFVALSQTPGAQEVLRSVAGAHLAAVGGVRAATARGR